MAIRQPTPLPNLTLSAGASGDKRKIPGQTITITTLSGAAEIYVAVDNGSPIKVCPGLAFNCAPESFSQVQFINTSDADVTFDAEVGWTDRIDTRTHIPNGEGLPVTATKMATLTPTAKQTIASGGHLDVSANADRIVLSIYNDGDGTVWVRDQSDTTAIGLPVGGKQEKDIENFTGAFRIVNASGASCDIYITEFSV